MCATKHALVKSLPPDIAKASNSAECGICLEVVMQKPKRFGLLSDCDHPFCLDCIKVWRNQAAKDITNPSTQVKTCPICRVESLFVIPSFIYCTGAMKATMMEKYKLSLKEKPCRYFRQSQECPFGGDCFYAHIGPDGTLVDSQRQPNLIKRGRKQHDIIPIGMQSSAVIELLASLSNMEPSEIMEMLMDLWYDYENGYVD